MPNKSFHMTHRCCSREVLKRVPVKLGPKTFHATSCKMAKTFHLFFFPFLLNIFKGCKCNKLRGCQASSCRAERVWRPHWNMGNCSYHRLQMGGGGGVSAGCRSLLPLPMRLVTVGWRLWMEAGKAKDSCAVMRLEWMDFDNTAE